jgi:hypothetical protein
VSGRWEGMWEELTVVCFKVFILSAFYTHIYIYIYIHICNWNCGWLTCCVPVPLLLKNRYTNLHRTWHYYFLRPETYVFNRSELRKVSRVRVPFRAVTAAPYLSTLEESCQHRSCLFRRGDYRNKDHNPEKCSVFQSRWRYFVYLG